MNTLYYEDLEVGQTFRSPARTVTEADLTIFAMVSGDWNPIHSDAEYARKTPYGQRIVHGVLGIAIVTGMFDRLGIFEDSALALLGIDEWRFLAPILVGDTVHMELEIAGKRLTSKGDRGIIDRRIRLVRHDGTVLQEGRMGMMTKLRPEA
ncbi:MAG TPA: MaoC/PaaZ C-terminal domain-containing protein [Thermohalobaculum sp.]|nr:MaoC/PaaZ C-terminal domain-containing protein [Thermohalobaculum sp.]